jgi:hypothetical protein
MKEEHIEDDRDRSAEGNSWHSVVGRKSKLEKVRYENFHVLYYFPDMSAINSRKRGWTVHVTFLRKERNAFSG